MAVCSSPTGRMPFKLAENNVLCSLPQTEAILCPFQVVNGVERLVDQGPAKSFVKGFSPMNVFCHTGPTCFLVSGPVWNRHTGTETQRDLCPQSPSAALGCQVSRKPLLSLVTAHHWQHLALR